MEDILIALFYGFERDYRVILEDPHHLSGGLGAEQELLT